MFDFGSEFIHDLGQSLLGGWYDSIYQALNEAFQDMFALLNENIVEAADVLTKSPETWNPSAFSIVKNISENAFLPVAGALLTLIFCFELVHVVQDSNNMSGQIIEKTVFVMVKLAICILVCTKAFDIVLAFFELGTKATSLIAGTSTSDIGATLSLADLVESPDAIAAVGKDYDFSMCMAVTGYLALIWMGKLITMALGAFIYFRCVMWFLEIYMMSAAASVPFSAWMNKDWVATPQNYTKKMLSLAFQGPMILLLFAIYGGVVNTLNVARGSFASSLFMIIGCGVLIVISSFKVSTLADSIFGAS